MASSVNGFGSVQAPMRRCLSCLLFVLPFFQHSVASGQTRASSSPATEPASPNYDIASFADELHRLSRALGNHPSKNQMGELRDSLPKRWSVTTSDGAYSISTQRLRNELTSLSAADAKLWVDNLAKEVGSYSTTATTVAENNAARTKLNAILARKEFAGVAPPSAWEILKQRVRLWILRQLLSLFEAVQRHPIGGRIVFWVILVGGVLAIAVWLLRFLAGSDRLAALPRHQPVGVSRTWQEWLRAAREAANRGDFREAVHSAYWAGIVRLQDIGVVPRDRTKTPREYLRLASEPKPAASIASPAPQKPLADLTSRLERFWYANHEAKAEDFQESLRELEALGCRLD